MALCLTAIAVAGRRFSTFRAVKRRTFTPGKQTTVSLSVTGVVLYPMAPPSLKMPTLKQLPNEVRTAIRRRCEWGQQALPLLSLPGLKSFGQLQWPS